MPVVRDFEATISIGKLFAILDSISAHVAAKLELFGADERTLTDDLCDMFCLWPELDNRGYSDPTIPVLDKLLNLKIHKTSQKQEAELGADLAIRVVSPRGVKYAVMQAKVYDPDDGALRCDSPAGWDKLCSQLVLMRALVDAPSFLLIYVPASKLDGETFGFRTWETDAVRLRSGTSARFGATLLSVDDLLSTDNMWNHSPPVIDNGDGTFRPLGITLSSLLAQMLCCQTGSWFDPRLFRQAGASPMRHSHTENESHPIHYTPYRELCLEITNLTKEEWSAIESALADSAVP